MQTGQVIRLEKNINFSETPCTSQMIETFLEHHVYKQVVFRKCQDWSWIYQDRNELEIYRDKNELGINHYYSTNISPSFLHNYSNKFSIGWNSSKTSFLLWCEAMLW